MKNFKTIRKGIILTTLAVALFVVGANGVLAATFNNDAQDYATLRIKNETNNNDTNTGWGSSASANAGETVAVAIYYHNTGPDTATNVRVRLTPQTTGNGTIHSFSAYVWADNASQVSGSATANLSSTQSISYSSGSVTWRPNQTTSGSQTLPSGQNGSEIFTTNGLLLGSVASGWSTQGSVVVSFIVGGSGGGGGAPIVNTTTATNVTQNSATLGCFVNPNGGTNTTRWIEYGTTQSLGSQTSTVNHGSTAMNINEYVSGLSPNTTYYFRCSAQNSAGVTNGNIVSFYTGGGSQIPSVTTYPADSVSSSFAVLNGFVNPNGTSNTTRWFEYGTNSWSFTNSTVKLGQGYNASTFNSTVTGLTSGTTYYYRAVAQNNASGPVYGNTQSFYTGGTTGQRPFVTTNTATNVTQNYATLNGYVNPYSDSSVTRWFEYGTSQSLGSRTNTINHGSTAANINDTISGLLNNTTYYFRAVAQNTQGTSYGSILSFSTGNNVVGDAPTAITNLATNIDQDSARLNGLAVVNSGGYVVTSGWFEWGSSQSLGNTTSTQTLGSSPSMSSYASLFGLSPNTTYYYRFVAQNQNGISRGSILNFRTNSYIVYPPITPGPVKTRNVSITKTIENLDSPNGTSVRISALRGEKARFTITVENTGDYTLEDVEIKDLIPYYLEFANADEVNKNDPQREVVWALGDMSIGERQSVILDVIVTGNARVNDVIDNIARIESKRITRNSNVVSIEVADKISSLTAASFFGDIGFLPDTLIEWLLLILLIFILVILSRKLYATNVENGKV